MNSRICAILLASTILLTTCMPVIYATPAKNAFGLGGRALIISAQEFSLPSTRFVDVTNDLKTIGYSVDVVTDNNVTVQFLKTALIPYDVVILKMLAYKFGMHPYYLLTGEPVTPTGNTQYNEDIIAGNVDKSTQSVYGVDGQFFTKYYNATGLRGKLIYIMASESFLGISDAFKILGASVFIGFTGPVYLNWGLGDEVTYIFFHDLVSGMNVGLAYTFTMAHLRRGDTGEPVASPFDTMMYLGNASYVLNH